METHISIKKYFNRSLNRSFYLHIKTFHGTIDSSHCSAGVTIFARLGHSTDKLDVVEQFYSEL